MVIFFHSNTFLGGKRMEANDKKYRKTPPYMTKTGVQIGLLYQEPFETRASKDADVLQQVVLKKRLYKPKSFITIDWLIVAISVVGLLAIAIGGFYGWV
jgi:hypothetical protein